MRHDTDTKTVHYGCCWSGTPSVCVLQVYTYLLRPLTASGRRGSGDLGSAQQRQQQQQQLTSGSVSDSEQQQQQLARCSTGVSAGRQGSGSEAIVGYELQLVMEYCPLVSDAPLHVVRQMAARLRASGRFLRLGLLQMSRVGPCSTNLCVCATCKLLLRRS